MPAVVAVLSSASGAPAVARGRCVLRADLDTVVHGAAADYLERAVGAVRDRGCTALLVVIDTPGGALDATRAIAGAFLQSDEAIIAYVHPGGAQAGSAGVFITAAAHVAAMTSGTNIGAAHPVLATGRDPQAVGGEEMARKVENDSAAFARAIAEKRGRNAEWLEKAVLESASATAREAHQLGVVDVVVDSVGELLERLDGSSVTTARGQERLQTSGAEIELFEATIRERALSLLARPNVAYLLLMAGMFGVMMELYNPGLFVAGGMGILCLLLAAAGLELLPVQLVAVGLVVAAFVLFAAELYVTSFGVLAAAGVVALITGSALLIDRTSPEFFAEPSVRVAWGVVIPLVSLFAAATGALAVRAARLRGQQAATGSDSLRGSTARALTAIDSDAGWVSLHGERWRARCEQPVPAGQDVRVVAVRGLTLHVRAERRTS